MMRSRPLRMVGFFLAMLAVACQDAKIDAPPESAWLSKLAEPSLTELWRIGELSGSPEYVFGKIGDVAVDSAQRVFVVDAMNDVVRVYGPDGKHIASAGREGQGPGEFVAAEKVALVPPDTILVTDRLGKISTFVLGEEELVFVDAFTIQLTPEDQCLLGDTVVVQGVPLGTDGIIHFFSRDGAHVGSFGELNPGANLIIQETFSWGSVVCLPSLPGILYVPDYSPELRLYDRAGVLLRRDSLPDYRIIPSEAGPGGRGSFRWSPPEGAHVARSVLPVDGSTVLIQLGLRDSTTKSAGQQAELQSLLWNARSGVIAGKATNLRELIAVRDDFAYAHIREPYPQIIKYRIGSHAE